jgi:hypothetical protein
MKGFLVLLVAMTARSGVGAVLSRAIPTHLERAVRSAEICRRRGPHQSCCERARGRLNHSGLRNG